MSEESVRVDPKRSALVIQDLQNDVITEGGAFADSGAPEHAKSQGVVENTKRLAEAAPGYEANHDDRIAQLRAVIQQAQSARQEESHE